MSRTQLFFRFPNKGDYMAGTKAGGMKAAAKNRALHGPDFYARIGAIGGTKGTTGGFAANRALARIAGAKGGRISRRRKVPTMTAPAVAKVAQADDSQDDQNQLAA